MHRTPADNPTRIRAVVFDLGGVVIDVDTQRTVRAWTAAAGLDAEEAARRLDGRLLYGAFERGEITPDEFHRHVCDLLDSSISREVFVEGWNALIGLPIPGVADVLAELQGHVRLAALTNTNETHALLWRGLLAEVLESFEVVIASHEIGARKPEEAAFRHVLDYLRLPPGQVLMLDDSPQNIQAARALGMQARQVTTPEEIRQALRDLDVL